MVKNDKEISLLVRVPNWIGDAVMCLPALDALGKRGAATGITVLAKPWVAPLFQSHPSISKVMIYDSGGRHGGLAGKWRLSTDLKRCGFDGALLFQNAFEAALISFLAAIPERYGYGTDGRGPLLTKRVKPAGKDVALHHVDYYLNLVTKLGLGSSGERYPRLHLAASEKQWGKEYLREKGVDERRPLIGFAPGAAYGPAKQWPAEKFSRVALALAERCGAYPVLFGSKGDREACRLVGRGIGENHLDLSGKTNLREAMAIMSRCAVFITNDSGLMHVSAALGVPTVAIFGSTDPRATGPLGRECAVLYRKVECSPCFKRECPTDLKCMEVISADEVIEAAMAYIGPSGGAVKSAAATATKINVVERP